MVKKKLSLWEAIKYYKAIQLLIFGLILYIVKDYAVTLLCTIGQVTERNVLYKYMPLVAYVGLAALWGYISFITLRDKRYYRLTGRNFGYDSGHYKPYMYGQLVDYFQDADPHKLDTTEFPVMNWQNAISRQRIGNRYQR